MIGERPRLCHTPGGPPALRWLLLRQTPASSGLARAVPRADGRRRTTGNPWSAVCRLFRLVGGHRVIVLIGVSGAVAGANHTAGRVVAVGVGEALVAVFATLKFQAVSAAVVPPAPVAVT